MGLDFDGADAHWSYSGFNRFREKVASSIGINLNEMYGFGGPKDWKAVKHPLKALLYHSDCDGNLSPKQCALVAPALRLVIKKWEKNIENAHDISQGLKLARGMFHCAKKNKSLRFC